MNGLIRGQARTFCKSLSPVAKARAESEDVLRRRRGRRHTQQAKKRVVLDATLPQLLTRAPRGRLEPICALLILEKKD